jgi:hypothetical protein
VLEDGALWAVAGPASVSSYDPSGLLQGTLQASNGTLSASDPRGFDLATGGAATSGSIAGSDVAGASMSLTATPAGSSTGVGVNLAAALATNHDYNQPAQPAAIAGSWSGFLGSTVTGTLNVQGNGAFGTPTSAGCQNSGTATPRASGIAVITRSGTTSPLTIGVMAPDRAFGGAFFGSR